MVWMQWWNGRRGGGAPAVPYPGPALAVTGLLPASPAPAAGIPETLPPPVAPADAQARYLTWLLPLPVTPRRTDPHAARRALAALDVELENREGWSRLVGRAPNIVPRLMNTLRSLAWSRADVAGLIERDPMLTALVMRRARSTLFAHLLRGRPPTLSQAIDLLGSEGLQDAVSRALMHPLFVDEGSGLRARAAGRLQEEAERCGRLTASLAPQADPVDAYLAGLLLGVGWSAVLRALELQRIEPLLHRALLEQPSFSDGLLARRDRLLGRLIRTWQLSAPLDAVALRLEASGYPTASAALADDPLHRALARAEDLVVLRRLQGNGHLEGGVRPPEGLSAAAVATYLED